MSAPNETWLNTRAAGVLAHVSSLPGDYGIGNLGADARRWVDLLADAGMRYWQICPIGPTGYGDSPYQTFSGRAGNPYFIDLGDLLEAGALEAGEVEELRRLPSDAVDYGRLYRTFWPVLARSHDRLTAAGADGIARLGSFAEFRGREASWLRPFSDFMALKRRFAGQPWTAWPDAFREWTPELRAGTADFPVREAERHEFYQYVFFAQWERLRRYAADRGVGIIGDVPIFVALDSADTWADRAVFRLDERGNPVAVAGVPPDYFAAAGQFWGNPLYDWEYLARTGYGWWIDRLKSAFALYDIIRLDHFRGFDTYWEIPAGAKRASEGGWKPGPGVALFAAIKAALPEAKLIAEDLGYIGASVVALREATGLPGMKVLQFAYGHDAHNVNLPHYYPANSVAYTGTHDNVTTRGWLESLGRAEAVQVAEYFQLRLDGDRSAWPLVRALLATVSRLAVVPLQDLLDLPASATLNRPGTAAGNWCWRCGREELAALARERAATLREWIRLFNRVGERPVPEYSEPPPH